MIILIYLAIQIHFQILNFKLSIMNKMIGRCDRCDFAYCHPIKIEKLNIFNKSNDDLESLSQYLKDQTNFYFNTGRVLFFLIDKIKAKTKGWRIREWNLLLCCLNAPIASLLSMQIFRHKVNRPRFYLFSVIGLFMIVNDCDIILDDSWKALGYMNLIFMIFSLLFSF